MNRLRGSAAGILVILSLVPTGTYASVLLEAGGSAAQAGQVHTGIWIAKAVLLLHALILLLAPAGMGGDKGLLPPGNRGEFSRRQWWILLGLVIIGTLLRVHQLGTGLWYDEIETLVRYARLPVKSIVITFDSQNQHVFYSVLSSLSIGVFGESAWALRLPAALFGVASLWAVWWLGRRITNEREALLATALLTFSYHHVWFSQNARGYTALLFWSLVGTGLFIELLRNGREGGWRGPVLYGLCMALAAYTHVTAVLVVVAHVLVLGGLWWRERGTAGRAGMPAFWGVLLATTFTLQLYALVLPQFLATLIAPSPHAVETVWKDPFWLALETLRGLAASIPGGWVALAGALAVGAAGMISFGRQSMALLTLLVLPGLLTGGLILGLGHNLWPRFFFFSAGFAVLVAIRGVFTLTRAFRLARPQLVATLASCCLVLGSAVTLARAWQPKQDYLGAAQFVRDAQGSNDAVVVVDLTEYPYRTYLQEPWSAVEDVTTLMEIERQHARTWVLYTFPIRLAVAHPDIWSRLQETYEMKAVFPGTVGGGAIVVMVNRPAPSLPRIPA
jgi:hypothetical protein